MKYPKRDSFFERIEKIDAQTKEYYELINDALLEYKNVKARYSLRCISYRLNGKLIAKMALGGKNLKLFLAINPNDEKLNTGKYHPRDVSKTKTYVEVPTMLPIKSQLATKKAIEVINMMMQ